jgi:hypothetical protein
LSTIIGIDNGASGSIGIIRDGVAVHFGPVPTQPYLHYGKKGSIGERLNRAELASIIRIAVHGFGLCTTESLAEWGRTRVYVERPFSGKFINAVVPAHRFFEATIITLEDLGLGYEVVDSGVWQKPVLGAVSGSKELKLASRLRGIQLYPQFKDAITKQGDADGLLIAHHFSRHA